MDATELEYVGFWARVGASLVDTLLIGLVIWPLLTAFYGWEYWTNPGADTGVLDLLISYVLPAVAVLAFWIARQATPGKMLLSARIVDAKTGGKPSNRQLLARYLGYFVAMIPFFLGILWVGIDARKQGWHDKLAGTVVVRPKLRGPQPVSFPQA